MGLFSKRSKARSRGSDASLKTDKSSSQAAASSNRADNADQNGDATKDGDGQWQDRVSSAADIGSQVLEETPESYLSVVGAASSEQSIVVHSMSTLATVTGETTARQAAQEVALATMSAALVAVGAPTGITPVLAAVVLVGHVVVRGVTRYVYRRVRVRADQCAHLDQLQLNQAEAPERLTLVINGVVGDGQFNAFASTTDNPSYALIDPNRLRGLGKLIGDAKGSSCLVRDMGPFTEDVQGPVSVRLTMPDVLALIRQSWEYENFSQTTCGTMTVVLIRSRRKRGKRLRVAWQNSGPLEYCQAMVFTEKEWKASKFSTKRTKSMPDNFADVDVVLDRSLTFV